MLIIVRSPECPATMLRCDKCALLFRPLFKYETSSDEPSTTWSSSKRNMSGTTIPLSHRTTVETLARRTRVGMGQHPCHAHHHRSPLNISLVYQRNPNSIVNRCVVHHRSHVLLQTHDDRLVRHTLELATGTTEPVSAYAGLHNGGTWVSFTDTVG